MTKGNYTVSIRQDATGMFFALMTYCDQCVPGFPGKYYKTRNAAEKAANRWLVAV
jgi:viroplasmin and RNaseH domain-containing protein